MIQTIKPRKSLLQRQIPTILGLVVLVVALIVGILFIGEGGGVFAPRATPQTTPKNVKITNVTDTSFTVSFLTDETTAGFIRYGTEANSLRSQASDDRDQLSGTVGSYSLHHITVRGLQANTEYFFTLGTGSNANFDNNGAPFSIRTAQRGGTPPAAKTIYGTVLTAQGSAAEGSIVYVSLNGVGELSSLVKTSGSWAVPLSNARTPDGSGFAVTQDTDPVEILVQGSLASQQSQLTTTVGEAQPVPSITLGQNTVSTTPTIDPLADPTLNGTPPDLGQGLESIATAPTPEAEMPQTFEDPVVDEELAPEASDSSLLSENLDTTGNGGAPNGAVANTVNLEEDTLQVVSTGQPVIVGKAAPGVVVNIQVNSETQINQQLVANPDGSFSLDISQLTTQLEPGEHTVTYSYIDPNTGDTVTKTQTFMVEGDATHTGEALQLAQATATPTPFGTGNPFPATTPEITATPSATTDSGRVSVPSTSSGVPVSGSIHTTMALIFGGLFFILAGSWSFLIAQGLTDSNEPRRGSSDHHSAPPEA